MNVERMLLPIACTLDAGAGPAQLAAWRAFNEEHLLRVDAGPGSVTARYTPDDAATARLSALVRTEQTCCAFATWTIDTTGGDLRLTVTGEPDALAALTFLARG